MADHQITEIQNLGSDDAAAYWHARINSSTLSRQEKEEFDAWLNASQNNYDAFHAYKKILLQADNAQEKVLSEEFEAELNSYYMHQNTPLRTYAAIAASLIAFVAVTFFIATAFNPSPRSTYYATNKGEVRNALLADGSEIELNTDTRIQVAFSKKERLASLETGEAVFNIEKDNKRPFIVSTPAAKITVTGTVFNVTTLDDNTRVSVLTGAVDVEAEQSASVTLLAGQSIEINENGIAGEIEGFNPSRTLAWRTGKIRFQETPLDEVVQELNRYFDTQLRLGDPALEDLQVTGEFNINDQASAIRSLELIFSLDSRESGNEIILAQEQD